MPDKTYKKILVPLDGSGWADRAVTHAARIAKHHDAEIILLHVYHSPLAQYRDALARANQTSLIDQEREQIRNHLVSLRNELRAQGVKVRGHILDGRDPAYNICQYVRVEEVDLVVMSTHGRSGLARFIFGSVAHKVMQDLDVPVMLVRPDSPAESTEDSTDLPPGEDIL